MQQKTQKQLHPMKSPEFPNISTSTSTMTAEVDFGMMLQNHWPLLSLGVLSLFGGAQLKYHATEPRHGQSAQHDSANPNKTTKSNNTKHPNRASDCIIGVLHRNNETNKQTNKQTKTNRQKNKNKDTMKQRKHKTRNAPFQKVRCCRSSCSHTCLRIISFLRDS